MPARGRSPARSPRLGGGEQLAQQVVQLGALLERERLDELPLGDDAIELVRDSEPAAELTETEVKLSLPGQETPNTKVKFGIEGIVDIVRENDRVVMYDLKTHEADYIRENKDLYRQQLNVYAFIWKNLRGERLDETAIICTTFPPEWKAFLNDDARLAVELAKWEPVIELDFDPENLGARFLR